MFRLYGDRIPFLFLNPHNTETRIWRETNSNIRVLRVGFRIFAVGLQGLFGRWGVAAGLSEGFLGFRFGG